MPLCFQHSSSPVKTLTELPTFARSLVICSNFYPHAQISSSSIHGHIWEKTHIEWEKIIYEGHCPCINFIKCFTRDEKCQANVIISMLFTFPPVTSHLLPQMFSSWFILTVRILLTWTFSSLQRRLQQEAFRFNPSLALPNVKHLCSAFSKSIGTQDISQWISDCSEQNIKHAFCFPKAGLKTGLATKASWKFMKTDNSSCIAFPFVWKPVLLKEFKAEGDCGSSSKQTTLSLHVSKSPCCLPAPGGLPHSLQFATHIPETPPWLQICCGCYFILYPQAVSCEATMSNRLSLGSDNGLKILLFGLCAAECFKCK